MVETKTKQGAIVERPRSTEKEDDVIDRDTRVRKPTISDLSRWVPTETGKKSMACVLKISPKTKENFPGWLGFSTGKSDCRCWQTALSPEARIVERFHDHPVHDSQELSPRLTGDHHHH